MNTKKCPECGEEMQADARRCPKCGAVLNLQASKLWVWILAIVILITLIYVGLTR
jgi:RNA polymerase subunit RPABC4/transcription elongation factor Spt4